MAGAYGGIHKVCKRQQAKSPDESHRGLNADRAPPVHLIKIISMSLQTVNYALPKGKHSVYFLENPAVKKFK